MPDHPAREPIHFSDLAAAIGCDEDFLLRRLARILAKRDGESVEEQLQLPAQDR